MKEIQTFSWLVNPEMQIPPNATQVHKITDVMVSSAATFPEIAANMINEVNKIASPNDVVVFFAHNGTKFDEPILKEQFTLANIPIPENWRFADTLPIFRRKLRLKQPKYTRPYSLENLHKKLCEADIPDSHRAGGDVEALEACLKKVISGNFCKELVGEVFVSD